MRFRKGGDEPDVTVRLLGTTLIVILGLVMSQGMAEGAFSSLSTTTNNQFVKQSIISNIKEVCKTGGQQNIPSNDEFKYTLNGVDKIRMRYHTEIGSDWYTFELKYKGGATEKYRVDSVGALASWACTESPGNGMYQINGSVSATGFSSTYGQNAKAGSGSGVGCNDPCWVDIEDGKPVKFRVMEEDSNKWVNVQVIQN